MKIIAEADADWRRCSQCTLVQPACPLMGDACISCGGEVAPFSPEAEAVFQSRKGHYRSAPHGGSVALSTRLTRSSLRSTQRS